MGTDLIVVTVGTDHHPFGRLVAWMDGWAGRHPETKVIIQRGPAPPTSQCESHPLIPFTELCELFASATAVVSHGGPSTVMDARAAGRLPIVLPRDPARGEHVDDHQIRFSRHLARYGLATVVEQFDDLITAVETALAAPDGHRVAVAADGPPGVAQFGRVLEELIGAGAGRTGAGGGGRR